LLKQKGFTLIEVSLVAAIGIAILLFSAPYVTKKAEEALLYQTIGRVKMIYENSVRFRVDTGSWPANTTALVAANYLPSSAIVTGWGNAIGVAPAGTVAQLSLTAPNTQTAAKLAGLMIAPTLTGTTITETFSLPGQEGSTSGLQDLEGVKRWRGDYNAGGNDLLDVDNLTADSFDIVDTRAGSFLVQNFRSLGQPCLAGQIAVSTTPELLICSGGNFVSGTPPPTPSRFRVNSSIINGLTPGDTVFISLYGITQLKGNGTQNLRSMRLTNCGSTTLATTRSLNIDWHDGQAPYSHSFPVIVPASGCLRGFGDGGIYTLSGLIFEQ
jgi:prepilin-type N-terminal cleavage/methylation domain-containing protein